MSTSISTSVAVGDASTSTSIVSASSNLPDVSGNEQNPTPTTYGSIVASDAPSSLDHATGAIVSLTGPVYAGGYGLTRIDQPMADVELGNFLQRDVLVRGLSGFANDNTTVVVFRPWADWAANLGVADKLKNYQYVRGDMVLTGKFMAPPLSSGLIAVTFTPGHNNTPSGVPVPYVLSPKHVLIDASTSSNFQVTLPWVFDKNWGLLFNSLYAEDDHVNQWHVTVTTLTGIRAGITDGCLAASLRIFARPENLQLSGARFQSGTFRSTSTALTTGSPASNFSQATATDSNPEGSGSFNAFRRTVNAKSREMTGGTPSQVLSEISGMAGAAAAFFPVIAPAAAAVSAVTGFAGAVAAWFGFTRHTKVLQPVEAHVRGSQNVMNCDGVDTSHIGALFASNRLCSDPAISGAASGVDEASFAYIASRFTRITTLTFTVGDLTTQDRIIPVTPCIGVYDGATTFYPSNPAFLASRFKYWRGDMEYLFYPVLTSTHRGALQFIWQPTTDGGVMPTDLTNLSLNVIADLAAARPIVVEVGYNSHRPVLQTEMFSCTDTLVGQHIESLNGYLRIRCIVPITGSICGQQVQVHVFAAAKGNLELMGPTDLVSFSTEANPRQFGAEIMPVSHFQSGMADTSTIGAAGQAIQRFTLVPLTGDYPIDRILAGERVKSVRALMEKPSLMTISSAAPDPRPDGFDQLLGVWKLPHTLGTPLMSIDYMSFFGPCFFSFAGSIRYKLHVYKAGRSTIGGVATSEYRIVPWISKDISLQTGGNIPIAEINPIDTDAAYVSEVTLPFYNKAVYVNTQSLDTYNDNRDVFQWDVAGMSGANYMRVRARLWRSITEDARLCYYQGPQSFELLESPMLSTNLLDFRFTT